MNKNHMRLCVYRRQDGQCANCKLEEKIKQYNVFNVILCMKGRVPPSVRVLDRGSGTECGVDEVFSRRCSEACLVAGGSACLPVWSLSTTWEPDHGKLPASQSVKSIIEIIATHVFVVCKDGL